MKFKVAVITLGDTRKEFYQQRIGIVERETAHLKVILSQEYDLYLSAPVFSMDESRKEAEIIKKQGIDTVIIHIPIWGTPNLVVPLAYSTENPVLLLGNMRSDSSSMGALLATAGMLEQAGKNLIRVLGDLDDVKTQGQIKQFIHVCKLVDGLKSTSFGLIGGRSIGIGTTISDPAQWLRCLHIDCDQTDQLEVVNRAEVIDIQRVQLYRQWLDGLAGLCFGTTFTEKSLEKQIRSYLAMKDIIQDKGYDFVALKCQQELSDHYAVQCLTVSLLNNTFDAEGTKKVVPCACEGDCDGALTMQMLHLLDDAQPACLVDIRFFNESTKEFSFANCGGMALGYADCTTPQAAMKKTLMMQHVFGDAGGGTTQFMTHGGAVTAARLFRRNGKYFMGVFEGVSVEHSRESLTSNFCYPHAFLKADIDFNLFIRIMGANHMHFIFGQHAQDLQLFCKVKDIEFVNFNTN